MAIPSLTITKQRWDPIPQLRLDILSFTSGVTSRTNKRISMLAA